MQRTFVKTGYDGEVDPERTFANNRLKANLNGLSETFVKVDAGLKCTFLLSLHPDLNLCFIHMLTTQLLGATHAVAPDLID